MSMDVSNVSFTSVEPKEVAECSQPECRYINLEDKPDSFELQERKKTPSEIAKKGIAGVTGVTLSASAISKTGNAFSKWATDGLQQMCTDFGKEVKTMPKTISGLLKYGTIALGAAAAFAIASKDSDNDGQLDILEGINKLFNPAK